MPPVLAFVIPYQVGNITFRASTQRDFILHCHSPYLFAYRPFKHPDLFHLTLVTDFKMGGNEALHVNPFVVNNRTVDIHITTRGSDWYWAVTSIMGTTMLAILGTSFLKPASNRIFHYVLAAVAFVAMVEHYSMAANLGWVPIDVEWRRSSHLVSGVNRQIWWVRYCGW
jgi:hypothetical protein